MSPSSVAELTDFLNSEIVTDDNRRIAQVTYLAAEKAYNMTVSDVLNFSELVPDTLVSLLFLEVICD